MAKQELKTRLEGKMEAIITQLCEAESMLSQTQTGSGRWFSLKQLVDNLQMSAEMIAVDLKYL